MYPNWEHTDQPPTRHSPMSVSPPAKQFLIRFVDGTQIGPLDKAAIQSMVSNGRLKAEDSISQSGTGKWMKAAEVKGLLTPSLSLHDSSSTMANSQSGVPRSLAWSLGAGGLLVIATTVVWFLVSQHKLAVRSQAVAEVRAAIDAVERADPSLTDDELARRAEQALALGKEHYTLLDDERRRLLVGVSSKLERANHRLLLRQSFESLKDALEGPQPPTVVHVPATGLFAQDPEAAEEELLAVGSRIGWMLHSVVASAVKNGEPEDIQAALLAQITAGRVDTADLTWLANLLARVGMAAHDVRIPAADLRRTYAETRAAFEARSESLRLEAEKELGLDASRAWASALADSMSDWDKRCFSDASGGTAFMEARDFQRLNSSQNVLFDDATSIMATALSAHSYPVGALSVKWATPSLKSWMYVENDDGVPRIIPSETFFNTLTGFASTPKAFHGLWDSAALRQVFADKRSKDGKDSVRGLFIVRLQLEAEAFRESNARIELPNSRIDLFIPCLVIQVDAGASAGLRIVGTKEFYVCELGNHSHWERLSTSGHTTAAEYGSHLATSGAWNQGQAGDSIFRNSFSRYPNVENGSCSEAGAKLFGLVGVLIGER